MRVRADRPHQGKTDSMSRPEYRTPHGKDTETETNPWRGKREQKQAHRRAPLPAPPPPPKNENNQNGTPRDSRGTIFQKSMKTTTQEKPKSYNVQITRRDIAILRDVARFKFLSSKQVHSLHFPDTGHRNATTRLTQLARGEMLSRVYVHPKVKGQEKSHPLSVFYFSPSNQKNLKAFLEENGKSTEWIFFEEILQTKKLSHNKSEEFSPLYLFHELGISDFFIELEKAQKTTTTDLAPVPAFRILFWERTSPFSREIGENLTATVKNKKTGETTTEKLYFNPDAFFAFSVEGGEPAFFFLEMDNDTESVEKFRRKLFAYVAFNKQGRFQKLATRYAEKYGFSLPNEKTGFRVLTLTPHTPRLVSLFGDSLKFPADRMFLYATLPTLAERGAAAPIYFRAREFAPHLAPFRAMEKQATVRRQMDWLTETLKVVQPVPLFSD